MKIKDRGAFTEEQAKAIYTRDVSVALSAGAGCGKTFVLTERFLEFFDPHNPDALQPEQLSQLIAITFTDRAAREMRDRIRRKCYDRLLKCETGDETSTNYWTRLLRFLDSARVSTIHSFCSSLLRSHAVEAQLDPQFAVLEQSEADTILSELIDDVIRQRLALRDEDTLELLVRFSLDQIRSMTSDLASRRERVEYAAAANLAPDDLLDAWESFHQNEVPKSVLLKIAKSRHASRLAHLARRGVSLQAIMQGRCATILNKLREWPGSSTRFSLSSAGAELDELHEAAKIIGCKEWVSDEVKEAFGKAATQLRDQIKKAKDLLAFDREAARPVAEYSLRVLRLTVQIVDAFERRKREMGHLDFDDLLTYTHRLLTDPAHRELQRQLSNQVRLLLVDEFQDTDPLQVELVKALCGEKLSAGRLFFVGDLKQSIYRFRGAKPQVFIDLQHAMPKAGQLPLSQNFRSQPAILHFVNALFHNELTESYQPLQPHRPQVGPTPAVEFLWAPSNSSGGKEAVEQIRQREAEWIARRLRSLLDEKEPIVYEPNSASASPPTARPAQPGDIAILFRALSDSELYEKALQRYGIPYYLVGGHAFYAQQEIYDLVNLLRAIASPADAISLAGVLRSPFFSLADETLFWLGQHPEGLTVGLSAAVHLPDHAEHQKVAFAKQTIEHLRDIKNRVPVEELINVALDLTGYDAALLAEFLGERKLANLNKLVDQARAFDRSGLFTLDDFIEQLSKFVANQPKEPFAAVHPEAGNVVRLMSIHMSKGLEFPIVVVPDMERASPVGRDTVEFTSKLGPMVKLSERPGESKRPVGGLDLYAVVASEEDEQESRRLLYVATTRAADYLMLSSGVKDLGQPGSPWMELLARHFDLMTGETIGELPEGWVWPSIHVTKEIPATTAKPDDGASRPDLAKLVASATTLASDGKGRFPATVERIAPAHTARRQFSFSRLTGFLRPDQVEQSESASTEFVLPGPILDPLGLGTLVHAVLASMHFGDGAQGRPASNIGALVHRHIERHIEEPHGEAEEAIAMLEQLITSPFATRLGAARNSYTELEFLLAWPPREARVNAIYLRGFIDRLWQDEAGDWHVVDFKTNAVTPESVASTANKYEMQMLVYALAVEQIFKQPAKSLTLYFLRAGVEHVFPWNLDARDRVIQMVNQAIAAAQRA